MANIKQQMKRDITNDKKRLLNASFNSSLKTAVKAFEVAVESGDKAKAAAAYSFACKKLDKSLTKGIHHKNYVARQKSRLANALNKMA
ncbi:MAG: 30S ribosomal protein S20 [Bacilli bacterium]|nr:30S ribosomal protein S20 [Mollicutes bacterium]MDY3898804.1 30S ribosomal protein S20 [Bacilli bacterium]